MAEAPGWTKVEESAPGWKRIPDQFDRTKAELEARPAMGALDYAKELGKLAVSPVTSIPGAVRQVLQFAQDPGSVAERNLNPRTADALPGAASSNPMTDAFGNAVLAASTVRGAPSIHEPELARLRDAAPQEAPPSVATPAPAKNGMGVIDAIRLVQKLRKLTPGKLADAAIDATLSHIEELAKPKPPAPPAEALQPTPQPVPKRGQPARPAAATPAPPPSAVTPEMAQQAAVPFTPEEQALADHVMAGVEPQPPAAPPVGSDYVMPEPAQPEPAGMPNVGDPRLSTPPVLPPPTFPQPEAPPATEPPAVNPGPPVNPPAPGSTPAPKVEMTPPVGEQPNEITGQSPFPRKLLTADGVSEYAKSNNFTEDEAAAELRRQGYGIVERGDLNRMVHAVGKELGLDHRALSLSANDTYGKGMGKITGNQMLEMYHDLASKQAMREPLASKTAERAFDKFRAGKVTSPEPMKPETKAPSEIELHRGGSEQGNYYSTDRDFAREFTHSGRDSEVRSLKVPTSDILDLGEKTPGASDVSAVDAAKEAAKSAGKRAFYVDEGQGQPRSVFILDKEAAPKPPTAAETEAAIRKQKMTELGELLNRKDESPAADVTPERTLYHGTAAPDFKAFKGMTYLTDRPVEASLYANGLPGAGARGGSPRVLHVKAGAGRVRNIAGVIDDAMMEDPGDIDQVIADEAKAAKSAGYRYLEFNHPGSQGGEIPVTVSLYPEDLSIQKSAKPSRSTKVAGGEFGKAKLTKAEIDKLPAKEAVAYLKGLKSGK